MGATVIAAASSQEKLEAARGRGADHLIDYARCDLRARLKEIVGTRGVDVVYDGVGGELSLESLRCVKFGARFLIVGWASTPP